MKLICVDPGHGGDDNGAAYGYAEEDDINLSVAYLLRCALQQKGFDVFLTRERDVYVSLEKRCSIANNMNADLFISIHCDAWHSEKTKGISTHIYRHSSFETEEIARKVHKLLTQKFPNHTNRGLKLSEFYVLRHTLMSAILVECEFISNPEMRKFLYEPENQLGIAHAITGGIVNRI